MTWDQYFMGLARVASLKSKDPSSQIGACAVSRANTVLGIAFNGPPTGVQDTEERLGTRPLKYFYCAHAEENLVAISARHGVALAGCTVYVYGLPPCSTCSRILIQAGVREIVVLSLRAPERWAEECLHGHTMLAEAGVKIRAIESPAEPTTNKK